MRKLYTVLCMALAAAVAAPQAPAQTEELPYEISFTSTNRTTWTAVDGDGNGDNFDNLKWCWKNLSWWYSLTSAQGQTPADDWVISPAFAISAGTQYEITYRINRYTGEEGTVSLELVSGVDTPAPVQTIDTWVWADRGKDKTVTFTATASGELRVGVHMTMTYPSTGATKIQFTKFSMKALSKATAPAGPTEFTATPDPSGARKVTLSFTAPTKDAEGNDLTGNVTVKLYKEKSSAEFYTSGPMAPGTSDSYTDEYAYNGSTYYMAKAVNDGGESVAVRADVWVGEDDPTAVTDLHVTYGDTPALTWKAPVTGQHGGYVNSAAMKYYVYRTVNGGKEALLARGITATSYTDESLDPAEQANVSYRVVPLNSNFSYGESASTPTFNMGAQLALPFAESFAAKTYTTSPWMYETVKNAADATREPSWELISSKSMAIDATDDNPEGTVVTIASQDTDQGMLQFVPTGQWTNYCESRLIFPAIDFSGMENPVLTFYIFREKWNTLDPATQNGRNDDYITVAARSDNGDFAPAEGEFHRYGTACDWELCEVPLFAFAGKARVQVALVGHGVGTPVYIDNIRIEERTAHDLALVTFSTPARVRIGEDAAMSVAVKNRGAYTVADYTAELYKDGAKVASATGEAIAPGKTAIVRFDYSPAAGDEQPEATFTAKAVYAKDQDMTNNDAAPATVAITAALRPAVDDLRAADAEGKVRLSWSKAAYLPAETLVESDNFEAYTPFAIDTFGDFTSYDLDGKITVPVTGLTYPNAGEKMACQIMTPALTDIDPEELDLWTPRSGSNMVVFPQATSASGDVASNDWLVFPALSGYAQTVKMWVRCVNPDSYPEYVLGYYATTARPTDADDFLPCPGSEAAYAVPRDWTEIDFTVPAGGRYFALRHISQGGYMLMLDDVTYQRAIPDLTPDGYHVYCNGERLTATPVAECAYEHTPADGTARYTVTAVYDGEESTASNEVEISYSGIDAIGAAPDAPAEYFNLQGIRVDAPAAGGVYIMRRGSSVTKVAL